MENFLERKKLSKLTQEVDNLNRPTPIKAIEFVVTVFPTDKTPGPDGFMVNSNKHLTKKYQIYTNLQKIEAKGILPNSFLRLALS